MYLVNLSPFLGGFFCEALVDHGHDLVEQLAGGSVGVIAAHGRVYPLVEGAVGDLLHQRRRSPLVTVSMRTQTMIHELYPTARCLWPRAPWPPSR